MMGFYALEMALEGKDEVTIPGKLWGYGGGKVVTGNAFPHSHPARVKYHFLS